MTFISLLRDSLLSLDKAWLYITNVKLLFSDSSHTSLECAWDENSLTAAVKVIHSREFRQPLKVFCVESKGRAKTIPHTSMSIFQYTIMPCEMN